MLPDSSTLRRLAVTHFLLECQFWFPVWMLFLNHRGFDLTTIVLADGVFRFAMVTLEFPFGVLSDRIGRKRSYLLVAALAVLTYAGITLVQGRLLLFLVWVLWGAFWALASGTTSAYCYELVAAEGRHDESVAVFGAMRAVASASALISQLAAGFLFAACPALPFIANGLLALGALGIAFTLPDLSQTVHGEGRRRQTFVEFLAHQRRNTAFFAGIALWALALVYFWSPRILMQPLFLELSLTPRAVSMVYFSYSLAGVFAGMTANRAQLLLGARAAVLAGIGLLWAGVMLVALVPGRTAVLFFPLLGFGYFLAHTLLEVLLHGQMDNRHRASVISAASLIGGVFIMFSRPGLGILADRMNTPFAFLVWALLGLPVMALFATLIRRLPNSGRTGKGGHFYFLIR